MVEIVFPLRAGRGKRRLVHLRQEGGGLFSGKAILALVRHRLIAVIVRALDCRPLDFAGLTGDAGALFRGVVFRDRLGSDLEQPDIAEGAVRLFRLEAHGEVRRAVGSRAHQYATVVNLVAEYHFLNGQRHIRHFGLEGQFGIGIQHVEFHIVGVLHVWIGVFRGDGRFDCARHQLKRTIGVLGFGILRKRRDDHVFQADRRGNLRGSGRRCHVYDPPLELVDCVPQPVPDDLIGFIRAGIIGGTDKRMRRRGGRAAMAVLHRRGVVSALLLAVYADGDAPAAVPALAYLAGLDGAVQYAGDDFGVAGSIGLHLLVDGYCSRFQYLFCYSGTCAVCVQAVGHARDVSHKAVKAIRIKGHEAPPFSGTTSTARRIAGWPCRTPAGCSPGRFPPRWKSPPRTWPAGCGSPFRWDRYRSTGSGTRRCGNWLPDRPDGWPPSWWWSTRHIAKVGSGWGSSLAIRPP
nr:MAG TPA: hypothetical protein [Caudoviricetes sp.]